MKEDQSPIIAFLVSSIIIIFMMINFSPFTSFWNHNREKLVLTNTMMSSHDHPHNDSFVVPFIVIRNVVGNFDNSNNNNYAVSIERHLQSIVSEYQKVKAAALSGLSIMLDQALLLEEERNDHHQTLDRAVKLSTRIQQRIERTASCLEHDEKIMTTLLNAFPYIMALPDETSVIDSQQQDPIENQNLSTTGLFQLVGQQKQQQQQQQQRNTKNNSIFFDPLENHSYDSATQVMAHLVRDWTTEGLLIRRSIYDWCCHQVDKHTYKSIDHVAGKHAATVLVPGAGLGRLAYDIYHLGGYHVEANELSPSMSAAASSLLQRKLTSGSVHPYVLDIMANEVNSERRYDMVHFPDVTIQYHNDDLGSLSYTVGDFVGRNGNRYYHQRWGHYDALVTCFFIDTAHNIYEYLDTIKGLLKPMTGVWINVGPVQWHQNAALRPSVDELKDLMESLGWSIKIWSIDNRTISYRDTNEDIIRATNYEGYRPLRFVAIQSG
jgi:SAM-dependent methyltransferase